MSVRHVSRCSPRPPRRSSRHATASAAAVLGYVHRARQAGQAVHVTRPTSARAQRRAARAAKVVAAPTRPSLPPVGVRAATVGTPMPVERREPVALIVAEIPNMPALLTLSDRQCRAIVDDETLDCCGLPTEGRSSWCRAHRAAYRAGTRPINLRGL